MAVLSSCRIQRCTTKFYSIHVPYPHPHRAQKHMDPRFSHTLLTATTREDAHSPLVHRHLPQRLLFPQWSWQAAILTGSVASLLSLYRSFAAIFAPGNLHSLRNSRTFHCHCPSRTSRSLAVQVYSATTSLLSCLVGKIFLATAIGFIGNYIRRVMVIKRSLYILPSIQYRSFYVKSLLDIYWSILCIALPILHKMLP